MWRRRFLLVLLLMIAHAGCALAQTNAKTINGKDGIQIAKITPRTNAEIPAPVRDFVMYLEVQARIVSTPKGRVTVRFYRYSPRTLKLVALTPAVERPLVARKGEHWRVQSPPITLANPQPEERLYVKACLLDGRGKMVAWSESFNPVRGTAAITLGTGPAVNDRVRVMPGTTAPGTSLKVNTLAEFVVKVRYDVKSSQRGVICIEFGEINDLRTGQPWSVSVIEVPAGTGEVELRRCFPVAPSLRGTTMAIAVSLRNDPLGGASARIELQPYPIGI